MLVTYLGNLGEGSAPHSTENHVARALEANGVEVHRIHEQRFRWNGSEVPDVDFVLWTHTHGFAPPRTHARQARFLESLRARGIPSVAVHLDRWWDLDREPQVAEEPFFRVDYLATADGGNDDRFAALGIEHHWFPPGVSEPECEPGTHRPELASDIAFVGSHFGGYHRESAHRGELVEWLRSTYGARCRFWPNPGEHAVRGEQLRDLYASVKVLVGDSCLVGTGLNTKYASDRIPETLGRGGFLVHPHVEGITDGTLWTAGEHLACWEAYDWAGLRDTIDHFVSHPEERRTIANSGRAHTLGSHTYEVRARDLLAQLGAEGMLDRGVREPGEVPRLVSSALPTLVQDR